MKVNLTSLCLRIFQGLRELQGLPDLPDAKRKEVF